MNNLDYIVNKLREYEEFKYFDFDTVDTETIDINYNIMNNLSWDEKTYYLNIEKINNLTINNNNYELYSWYDVSGFDYWKKHEENNYVIITLKIKNTFKLDYEQLRIDINFMQDSIADFIL